MAARATISAFVLALALAPALTAAPPDTALAARTRFLAAQVTASGKNPSPQKLAGTLQARFLPPSAPEKKAVELPLLLAASMRVDGLDNPGLFNALLGQPRTKPAMDARGKTALMYAAEADHLESLRTLLPYSEKNGFTPLYGPAHGKPYIDWCDQDGYTALMHACGARSVLAVNYLLNAGASMTPTCRIARFDAMQLAEISRDPQIIAALQREQARVDEREKKRQELQASMRWIQDPHYWWEMVSDRQVTAGILLALLAWFCYLAVWGIRRQVRLNRVGEVVQTLAEKERFVSVEAQKSHVEEVRKAILGSERFRTRVNVHPNLVREDDRRYVEQQYPVISEALRRARRPDAEEGAVSHG